LALQQSQHVKNSSFWGLQETAYLIEAVDYYNEFINGASSIAAVNNWDNQFYATSLLLWQLTGNTTYEDKVEVRHLAFDSGTLTDKFGRAVDNSDVLDAVVAPQAW